MRPRNGSLTMAEKKQDLTTQEVIERLGRMYPSPQYGFLTQVRSGTGYYAARTADALAMSLWPSRGLHLYGFEVKVSRTDWMKELKNPQKAEELASYTHFWYMVFGSEDIFKITEVPEKWGVIVPSGKGLKIIKQAPINTEVLPIDYLVLAGIFRNVAEQCIPKELLKREMDERYQAGQSNGEYNYKQIKDQFQEVTKNVSDFENAAGITLKGWTWEKNHDPKEVGEAVRAVLNHNERVKVAKEEIKKLKTKAENIAKYLDGEIKRFEI